MIYYNKDTLTVRSMMKSDYVSLAAGLHSGYGSAQRMYVK